VENMAGVDGKTVSKLNLGKWDGVVWTELDASGSGWGRDQWRAVVNMVVVP
jgi:hypothetical protein